jgi:hypothetical protein
MSCGIYGFLVEIKRGMDYVTKNEIYVYLCFVVRRVVCSGWARDEIYGKGG